MTARTVRHALAFLAAVILVFGLKIQAIDLQPLIGSVDQRYFETYTPYFPGLASLETHEIFAPENASKKKIVFFGASAVDAIGCDSSWSKPQTDAPPNVHFTCSVAGQTNRLLAERHIGDWKAFSLARNGMKLTPALYAYARILALQPDIVVLGEAFNYYMLDNADATTLTAEQYAYMDAVFGRFPETAAIWRSYKENLLKHGWIPRPPAAPLPDADTRPRTRPSTTLSDLIIRGLAVVRSLPAFDGMPRPVAFDFTNRAWARAEVVPPHPFVNPDADFAYFQGYRLFGAMQKRIGRATFFYFTPQWDWATDTSYQNGLTGIFGGYLAAAGIPFVSYVPMSLTPIRETYDGVHQTPFGNRRIATAVLDDLKRERLFP
jgi:hypothetical protein